VPERDRSLPRAAGGSRGAAAPAAGEGTPTRSRVEQAARCRSRIAQERIWLLDQLYPGTTAYNVTRVLRVPGRLHAGALAHALRSLVERHEILRTVVSGEASGPRTRVLEEFAVQLDVVELEWDRPVDEEARPLSAIDTPTPLPLPTAVEAYERFESVFGGKQAPFAFVDLVALAPGGSLPIGCFGRFEDDREAIRDYVEAARDPATMQVWLDHLHAALHSGG